MKRKNVMRLWGAVLAVSMVMTGCGNGGSSEEKSEKDDSKTEVSDESESSDGEDTVLNFYYWDEGQKKGMDAMISLFEESHPNITVETTIVPWNEYFTKLQTSLPNGTGPDVFWMNLYGQPYYEAGLIYDMTEKIEEDGVDMSKFPEAILAGHIYNDHYYGIPKDYDGNAIFYNKEIFDEMGVDYPKEGWSWEEFRDTAKALTNDKYYGYASSPAGIAYRSFVISNGGHLMSDDKTQALLNEPQAVEAFQFLHDLMYVDKVSPVASEMVETQPSDMFKSGKTAMVADGSWMLGSYVEVLGDKLGIMEMPLKDGNRGYASSGLAYCMSANGKNIDAAWEFCKFAATKEAQEATVSAAIPAHKDAADAWLEMYSEYEGAHYLIECINYAVSNPIYANGTTAEGENINLDYVNEAWLDENADIQDVMDRCVDAINTTISKAAK